MNIKPTFSTNSNNPDAPKVCHPKGVKDALKIAFGIDAREDLRPDQKIVKLTDLAKKHRTGWPFNDKKDKPNSLCDYGYNPNLPEYRNLLECNAATIADRIHRIELIKHGRDVGKTEAAVNAEKAAKGAEAKKGMSVMNVVAAIIQTALGQPQDTK